MSQLFDTKRFSQTLHHYIAMRGSKFLSIIGMALGLVLVFIVLNALTMYHLSYKPDQDPLWGMLEIYFWVGIVATACICNGLMFEPLGKKTTATSMLMLPASQLEKYLSHILICTVFPVAAFIIGFEALDALRCVAINMMYHETMPAAMVSPSFLFGGFDYGTLFGLVFFACIQSDFALGSSIWPRRGVFYSFFALLILSVAFTVWIATLLYWIANDQSIHLDFDPMNDIPSFYITLLMIIGVLVNYVICYYRFKESEIINRF